MLQTEDGDAPLTEGTEDGDQASTTLVAHTGLETCPSVVKDTEILGALDLTTIPDVATPEECCLECKAVPFCRAWTWTLEEGCAMKRLPPGVEVSQGRKMGAVSGLSFPVNQPASIFCFALMLPHTYEQELLTLQLRQRANLFACDEYAVYSSEAVDLAPGVRTSVVDSDLKCKKGGEFGTALNTPIFMAVWTKVMMDGRFRYHDWTVKVDPDTVFFVDRLRIAVHFHPETGSGTYLNNCKFGLHGPIEVFSRKAVVAWATGSAECMRHFTKLCSGPCLWGEDMFIDQCLSKVLKINRVDDWNLLSEPHCASIDWMQCSNGNIAFHPFKTVAGYQQCLKNANYGALPLPE